MDVVYVVKPGEENPRLRFSLRSLDNLEHSRVWVVGFCPSWVTGVEVIERVADEPSKYQRSTANLRAALEHPDVPEEFVLMNDDFYVTRPMDSVPVLHRGRVAMVWEYYREKYDHEGTYMAGMRETWSLLERWGHDDPLSYEVHAPLPVRKGVWLEALDRARRDAPEIVALHKRTLYGNVAGLGGSLVFDPKVLEETPWEPLVEDGFLSSSLASWYRIEPWLQVAFPDPCPYELTF